MLLVFFYVVVRVKTTKQLGEGAERGVTCVLCVINFQDMRFALWLHSKYTVTSIYRRVGSDDLSRVICEVAVYTVERPMIGELRALAYLKASLQYDWCFHQ